MSPKEWKINTFGWARLEIVGALANSVFLYALCFNIFIQALKRFFIIQHLENPQLILIAGGTGLIFNIIGISIFFGSNEMIMAGVFLDAVADTLGSLVVLTSAFIFLLSDWEYRFYLDPLLSLVIVLIISCSTWPLLRRSTTILMNCVPDGFDVDNIREDIINKFKSITNVVELNVWTLNGRDHVVSCELESVLPNKNIICQQEQQLPKEKSFEFQNNHMNLLNEVKTYFHDIGLHDSTVDIQYKSNSLKNNNNNEEILEEPAVLKIEHSDLEQSC